MATNLKFESVEMLNRVQTTIANQGAYGNQTNVLITTN